MLFWGVLGITIVILWGNNLILISKWRSIAGLSVLIAISTAVFFRIGLIQIYTIMVSGWLLFLISLFFHGSHPMHQYAAIRHVNADNHIESDEIYLRSASVVKMLESKECISTIGESIRIERYLYSPRIGLLDGKLLGKSTEFPIFRYETSGIPSWLFGVRVACEQFAFFALNLWPLFIAYGLFCQWKEKPPNESLALDPLSALFLTGPFAIGLIPLIGT